MGTTLVVGIGFILGALVLFVLLLTLLNLVLLKPRFPKGLDPNLSLGESLNQPDPSVKKASLDYCVYFEKDGENVPEIKNRRKLILDPSGGAAVLGVNAVAFKKKGKKEIPFDAFRCMVYHHETIEKPAEFPLSKRISSLLVTPFDRDKKALPRVTPIRKFLSALLAGVVASACAMLGYLGAVSIYYSLRYGSGMQDFNYFIVLSKNPMIAYVVLPAVGLLTFVFGLFYFAERKSRKGHVHG